MANRGKATDCSHNVFDKMYKKNTTRLDKPQKSLKKCSFRFCIQFIQNPGKGAENVCQSDDISQEISLLQDLKNSAVKIYEYERARLAPELRYKNGTP